MATFTVIEALQADPIWEADFKFNFEHVGFGVTLRERSRNNKWTFKPIILKPRGEARAEKYTFVYYKYGGGNDVMTMGAIV